MSLVFSVALFPAFAGYAGKNRLFRVFHVGVTKKFMLREYKRSLAEEVTPNCRAKCAGCGAAKFGCGVCVEARN